MSGFFVDSGLVRDMFLKFKELSAPIPPDKRAGDRYDKYLQAYRDYNRLGHAVILSLAGREMDVDWVHQGIVTKTASADSAAAAAVDKKVPCPVAVGAVDEVVSFETGSELSGSEAGTPARIVDLVSKRKSTQRKNKWKSTVEGTKVLAAVLPPGLCYAALVRAQARESVAVDLSFWPTFEDILLKPVDSFITIDLLTKLKLSMVQDGKYHVSMRSTPGSCLFVYAMRELARGCTFDFGTFGYALANYRNYVPYTVPFKLSLTDRLGGSEFRSSVDASPSTVGQMFALASPSCWASPAVGEAVGVSRPCVVGPGVAVRTGGVLVSTFAVDHPTVPFWCGFDRASVPSGTVFAVSPGPPGVTWSGAPVKLAVGDVSAELDTAFRGGTIEFVGDFHHALIAVPYGAYDIRTDGCSGRANFLLVFPGDVVTFVGMESSAPFVTACSVV